MSIGHKTQPFWKRRERHQLLPSQ